MNATNVIRLLSIKDIILASSIYLKYSILTRNARHVLKQNRSSFPDEQQQKNEQSNQMWLTLSCIFLRIQFSGQIKLERVSEHFYLFKNAIEQVAVASKKYKYHY